MTNFSAPLWFAAILSATSATFPTPATGHPIWYSIWQPSISTTFALEGFCWVMPRFLQTRTDLSPLCNHPYSSIIDGGTALNSEQFWQIYILLLTYYKKTCKNSLHIIVIVTAFFICCNVFTHFSILVWNTLGSLAVNSSIRILPIWTFTTGGAYCPLTKL